MGAGLATLGIHDLPLFVVAGLLLNLTPGADLIYVAGNTAAGGRRAAHSAHQTWAFSLLGLVFTVNGTLVTLAMAWLAGAARERLAGSAHAGQLGLWLQRAAGAMFVGLGVKLAVGGR